MDLPGDKDIVKIAAVLDFPSGPVVMTLGAGCEPETAMARAQASHRIRPCT